MDNFEDKIVDRLKQMNGNSEKGAAIFNIIDNMFK